MPRGHEAVVAMKITRVVSLAIVFIAACAGAAADAVKDYPARPLRLIVPNAPGSGVDTLGRIIANRLIQQLGQQIVVDNRVGAGGIIGMEVGKNAAPDGYTLIIASTSTLVIAPLLQSKPPYDPVNDFGYVMQIAITPGVVAVNPLLPVKTTKDLIEYAKVNKINMASAGPGSQSHLAGVALMHAGKFMSLHVPYKGGGTSELAVISGESHWILSPAPAVMSHVNAGRMRALGHTLRKPTTLLGNIPPIADTIPGFNYSGWQGFLVPRGTSRAVVAKLHHAISKSLGLPEVKNAFAAQATEMITGTPEDFRKVVQQSVRDNHNVIKAVGLQVN